MPGKNFNVVDNGTQKELVLRYEFPFNDEVVHLYGDEVVDGVKTFLDRPQLNNNSSSSQFTVFSDFSNVAFSGDYNDLINIPPVGANYYHSTGTWSGLTYTASNHGGAPNLAFTIPTGTTGTTVALGNHTHPEYYRPIKVNSTEILGTSSSTALNIKSGSGISLSSGTDGSVTIATTGVGTDTKNTVGIGQMNSASYYYLVGVTDSASSSSDAYAVSALNSSVYLNSYSLYFGTASPFRINTNGFYKEYISPGGSPKTLKINIPTYTASSREVFWPLAIRINGEDKWLVGADNPLDTDILVSQGIIDLGDVVTSVSTTGTGNAFTTASFNSGSLTLTKGKTFVETSEVSPDGNRVADKIVSAKSDGTIQTEKLAVSSGSTTKVTLQYDTTTEALEFVF